MSKKTLGAVVIALALFWSGAAFGQAEGANVCFGWDKMVTFPYLTSSGDFTSGFALINLNGDNRIPRDNLCFYARTFEGRILQVRGDKAGIFPDTAVGGQGIPARGMMTTSLDALAEADGDDRWKHALVLGVYANNATALGGGAVGANNLLRGFAMIGDGMQAQSYNAINRNAAEGPGTVRAGVHNNVNIDGNSVLSFDYLPTSAWNAGLSIANVGAVPTPLQVRVFYADGTIGDSYTTPPLAVGSMRIGLIFDDPKVFPKIFENKAMRIVVTATAENARIHGFSFFGDGQQGQGMLPVYHGTDTAPFRP